MSDLKSLQPEFKPVLFLDSIKEAPAPVLHLWNSMHQHTQAYTHFPKISQVPFWWLGPSGPEVLSKWGALILDGIGVALVLVSLLGGDL